MVVMMMLVDVVVVAVMVMSVVVVLVEEGGKEANLLLSLGPTAHLALSCHPWLGGNEQLVSQKLKIYKFLAVANPVTLF